MTGEANDPFWGLVEGFADDVSVIDSEFETLKPYTKKLALGALGLLERRPINHLPGHEGLFYTEAFEAATDSHFGTLRQSLLDLQRLFEGCDKDHITELLTRLHGVDSGFLDYDPQLASYTAALTFLQSQRAILLPGQAEATANNVLFDQFRSAIENDFERNKKQTLEGRVNIDYVFAKFIKDQTEELKTEFKETTTNY